MYVYVFQQKQKKNFSVSVYIDKWEDGSEHATYQNLCRIISESHLSESYQKLNRISKFSKLQNLRQVIKSQFFTHLEVQPSHL